MKRYYEKSRGNTLLINDVPRAHPAGGANGLQV